jgi:hypothetical protein
VQQAPSRPGRAPATPAGRGPTRARTSASSSSAATDTPRWCSACCGRGRRARYMGTRRRGATRTSRRLRLGMRCALGE